MKCQRPGTAWQNAWSRPSGSTSGASVVAKTTPEVPSVSETTPGRTAPAPTAPAAWSPPPAITGVPFRRPVAAAASAVTRPSRLRPLEGGRQPLGRDLELLEHALRPGAGLEVEQDRAGAIGLVHRRLAGEAQADVVLGEQHELRLRVDGGLVVADPEDLGGSEAGERDVAHGTNELGPADARVDLVALGPRALVVPQDRGPQHVPRGVEQDEAVHLAGEADRGHVVARRTGVGEGLADAGRGARPPLVRVLLGPERLRGLEREGRGGRGHHPALLVDQERLGARRRDVDAEEEALHVNGFSSAAREGGRAARLVSAFLFWRDFVPQAPLCGR